MALSKADELKNQGNKALQEQKFDEAIALYTQAIELDDSNHVFFSNRSAAYATKGDYNGALKDAEQTVKLKPDWGKGYSRLGAALSYLGKDAEAHDAYEDGLKHDPNNAQLKTALKELDTKLNRLNNPFADPNLEAKLAMDPRTRDYLNDPSFIKMLNQLKSDPSKLNLCAQDPRMMTVLSILLGIPMDMSSQADKKQEKEEKMEQDKPTPKETSSKPEDKLTVDQREAMNLKELGNAAYKKKDFTTAHAHYDKAISLDPTNITFLTNKAAVLFEEEKYNDCIDLCLKAVDVGRENRADYTFIAKPLARIGNVYFNQKDYTNAIKYYDHSLAEHRNDAVVKKLAQVHKIIKDQEKQAYLNPELAEVERDEGNKLFKAGKFPEAIKRYGESLKRSPDDPRVYSNRAACYTKLAEFGLALKDVDECLRLDPKFIKAYLRKGSICLTMKESTRAREAYEKALGLDPNCQEARDGLQNCFKQKMNLNPEERRKQAMDDPEIQSILMDPAMRLILEQMQENPEAASEHMKNPAIREKISKLVESGILQVR